MRSLLALVSLLAILPSIRAGAQEEPALSCIWSEYLADNFNHCLALASRGVPSAEYTVGQAYLLGSGTDKSQVDGENWITESAKHGYPDAEYFMGQICEARYKRGEDPSPNKAKDWFVKAAKHGHSDAQYSLALWYINGKGLTKNVEEAIKWLVKSAEAGNNEAAMYLAELYKKGIEVPKSNEEYLKWLKKAADNDDLQAQTELGLAYFNGNDVVAKDNVEATKWLTKAAEQGLIEAQIMLGFMLNSVKWFSKAVDLGRGDDVCLVYFQPRDYLRAGADLTKAAEWCTNEAEKGNSDAQFALALMHKSGKMQKNEILAYKWAFIAEKANHELSREILKKWQSSSALSDEDRKKADELVNAWLKKHPLKPRPS